LTSFQNDGYTYSSLAELANCIRIAYYNSINYPSNNDLKQILNWFQSTKCKLFTLLDGKIISVSTSQQDLHELCIAGKTTINTLMNLQYLSDHRQKYTNIETLLQAMKSLEFEAFKMKRSMLTYLQSSSLFSTATRIIP